MTCLPGNETIITSILDIDPLQRLFRSHLRVWATCTMNLSTSTRIFLARLLFQWLELFSTLLSSQDMSRRLRLIFWLLDASSWAPRCVWACPQHITRSPIILQKWQSSATSWIMLELYFSLLGVSSPVFSTASIAILTSKRPTGPWYVLAPLENICAPGSF